MSEAQRILQAHGALLAVCEAALAHVQELEEAWRRGAITEHDGKGGTRSNRNVDVRAILADAISGKHGRTGLGPS